MHESRLLNVRPLYILYIVVLLRLRLLYDLGPIILLCTDRLFNCLKYKKKKITGGTMESVVHYDVALSLI